MPPYSDRIFQGKSTFPGLDEWFYRTREGVAGPYFSREDAARALGCFIKYCQENRMTGGRDRGAAATAAAAAGCGPFQAAAAMLWALSGRLPDAPWTPAAARPRPGWFLRANFEMEF
jgi:hypothetical protein